jgi:hypothetical protein
MASVVVRQGRTAARSTVVVAALVASLAHIPVIAPHLAEAPYMGVLFILLTVACVLSAAALAVAERPLAYAFVASCCGAAVIGYAATRLVPFPQLADDVGNWFEPLGVLAVLSELVVVTAAVVALRHRPVR